MNSIKYTLAGLLFITAFYNTLQAQTTSFSEVKVEAFSSIVFEEVDGIAIVEAESVNPGNGWRGEALVGGFSGKNYLRWASSDKFNSPGNGLCEYSIKINNPGTYHFRWHSKIMHGLDATESNDSWLRIPDVADFFAQEGSSVKYPKGGMFVQSNKVTEGSSSDGWMKVYSSGTTSWTWSCRTSDNDAHEIYVAFDTVGTYTIQISGRSQNHAVDRFVLFNDSIYTLEQATDLTLEETIYGSSDEGRYALAVNNGTGFGNYPAGENIEINADNAPLNKVFDQWVGDVEHIVDIYESKTTLTIVDKDVVVTATYMSDEETALSENESFELNVYPNPAKGSFTIEVPNINDATITVYNLIGEKMYVSKTSSGKQLIGNHNLVRGSYVVQVSGDSKVFTQLITIQ